MTNRLKKKSSVLKPIKGIDGNKKISLNSLILQDATGDEFVANFNTDTSVDIAAQLDKVNAEINNSILQINALGFSQKDVDKQTDERNVLYKLLGFKQDVPLALNLLDLLDRPANTVRGMFIGYDASGKYNPLQAAADGFFGRKEYSVLEVLKQTGIDISSWPVLLRLPLTIGYSMVLDPLTYANAPVELLTEGLKSFGRNLKNNTKTVFGSLFNQEPWYEDFINIINEMSVRFRDAFNYYKYKAANVLYKTMNAYDLTKAMYEYFNRGFVVKMSDLFEFKMTPAFQRSYQTGFLKGTPTEKQKYLKDLSSVLLDYQVLSTPDELQHGLKLSKTTIETQRPELMSWIDVLEPEILDNGEAIYTIFKGMDNFTTEDWTKLGRDWISAIGALGTQDIPVELIFKNWQLDEKIVEFVDKVWKRPVTNQSQLVEVLQQMGYTVEFDDAIKQLVVRGTDPIGYYNTPHSIISDLKNNTLTVSGVKYHYYPFFRDMNFNDPDKFFLLQTVIEHLSIQSGLPADEFYRNMLIYVPFAGGATPLLANGSINTKALREAIKLDQNVVKFGDKAFETLQQQKHYLAKYKNPQVAQAQLIYNLKGHSTYLDEFPYNNIYELQMYGEYENYILEQRHLTKTDAGILKRVSDDKIAANIRKRINRIRTSIYSAYPKTRTQFRKLFKFKAFGNKAGINVSQTDLLLHQFEIGDAKYEVLVKGYETNREILELGAKAKDATLLEVYLKNPDGTTQILGYSLALFPDSPSHFKRLTDTVKTKLKADEYENLTKFFNNLKTIVKQNDAVGAMLLNRYEELLYSKLTTAVESSAYKDMFVDVVGMYGSEYGFKQKAFEIGLWNDLDLSERIKNVLVPPKTTIQSADIENLNQNFIKTKHAPWNETFHDNLIKPFYDANHSKTYQRIIENQLQQLYPNNQRFMGMVLLFDNSVLGDAINVAANSLDFQTKLVSTFNGRNTPTRLQAILDLQFFNYNPEVKAKRNLLLKFSGFEMAEKTFINKINQLNADLIEALKTQVMNLGQTDFLYKKMGELNNMLARTLDDEILNKIIQRQVGLSELNENVRARNIINIKNEFNGNVELIVDMVAYNELMEVIGYANNIDLRSRYADYFKKLMKYGTEDPAVIIKPYADDDFLVYALRNNTASDALPDVIEKIDETNRDRFKFIEYARQIRNENLTNVKNLLSQRKDLVTQHNTKIKGTNYQTKDARIWTQWNQPVGVDNTIQFHTWSYVYEALNRYKNLNINRQLFMKAVGDENIGKYISEYGDLHLPSILNNDYILQRYLQNFAKTPDTARKIVDSTIGNLEKKLATKSYVGSATDLNLWAGKNIDNAEDYFNTAHYNALAIQFEYTAEAFKRFNLLETSIQNELIKPITETEILQWTNYELQKTYLPKYGSAKQLTLNDYENFAKNYNGYLNEFQFADEKVLAELEKNLDLYEGIAGRDFGMDNVKDWVKQLRKMLQGDDKILIHRATLHHLSGILKHQSSLVKKTASFWNFIDKYVVRPFKKVATFSAGFHLRNIIGNYMNAWLAGINPAELSKYKRQSIVEYEGIKRVWTKALQRITTDPRYNQAFSLSELKNSISKVLDTNEERYYFDLAFDYLQLGLWGANRYNDDVLLQYNQIVHSLKSKGQQRPNELKGWFKKVNDMFDKSQRFAEAIDAVDKIALYHYAKSPKGQKLVKQYQLDGIIKQDPISENIIPRTDSEIAADFAKFVFFDYTDISPFERNVLKKAFPFYTWMRKNFEFHLKNFAKNSKRYSKIIQFYNGWRSAFIDDPNKEEVYLKYTKIPIWDHGDGRITYINTPLTILNIPQVFSGTDVVNGLNPIFKWPLEQILGLNFFTGKQTEPWKYLPFGFDYLFTIPQYIMDKVQNNPEVSRPSAADLGILGTRLLQFADAATNWLTIGDPNFNPLLFFPSFFSEYDTNKVMLNNRLRYARKLNDYLNALRQSGKYVPTIQEILPNKYGAINPKYQRLSPRYTYKQLMKLVRYEYQKNYKR